MIRIYGGNVTAGAQDGVEVGTEENPIIFDGLYPAINGQTAKLLKFAIRTDGEIITNLLLYATILDQNYRETKGYIFLGRRDGIYSNDQTKLYINTIDDKNTIFTIRANAYGTESALTSPDLRGKLYIVQFKDMVQVVS